MRTILLVVYLTISFSCLAQQNKYAIEIGYGKYSAANLKQKKSKDYYLANFSYAINNYWTVTSGFTAGQFNYYDDVHSNADTEITKYTTETTNARGYDFHSYAIIKYNILSKKSLSAQIGLGIGMLTQRLKYPYRQPCSSGCEVFIGEVSSTTIEIPVGVELHYSLNNTIGFGMTVGSFINSKFSVVGGHIGPQIRVKL